MIFLYKNTKNHNMPKFKENTSKAVGNGPYKMKYKHSAFPFKSSPTKQTGPSRYRQGPTAGQPGQEARVQPHQHGRLNDPHAIIMPGDANDPVMPGGQPEWMDRHGVKYFD